MSSMEREVLRHAAKLLRDQAGFLRESHAIDGKWPRVRDMAEIDRSARDECLDLVRTARALRRMARQQAAIVVTRRA